METLPRLYKLLPYVYSRAVFVNRDHPNIAGLASNTLSALHCTKTAQNDALKPLSVLTKVTLLQKSDIMLPQVL